MAGEIGQVGALAYRIPQRFGLPPQQAAAAEVAQAGPQVQQLSPLQVGDHLLAEREQLTDDYYNNYGILDAYVRDMAKKGVDAFTPDYTQPGGGEVFKTLQRLKANYYHGANALAVEQEAQKQRDQDIADNKIQLKQGVDTQGFYATDPNNYQNLQVDPMIVEKNKYLGSEFSDEAEVARAKQTNYDPAIKQLLQQRQSILDSGGKEGVDTFEVDRAIQTLTSPNRVDPALRSARISAASRIAAGKKNSYDLNVLKDWYNAFSGNWKPGKPGETTKTRTDPVYGKVFVYNDKNGKKVGSWPDAKHVLHDKTIKDIIKTPDGRVFVNYTDPAIPRDEVTDPQDFAQKAMSETSYGRAIALAADEGLVDTGGALISEGISDPDAPVYEGQRMKELGTSDKDVLNRVAEDKAKLAKLDTHWYGNDTLDFKTPKGTVEVKAVGDGKYDIENFDEIFPGEDDPEPYENLTQEQIVEKLNELGAYDEVAPTAPSPTVQAIPPPATDDNEYKASNGEWYTRQELAGYSDKALGKLPQRKVKK